jgi:hypothetical protein
VKIDQVLFPIAIIALKNLPAGRYHILAPFVALGTPTRYELSILNQYVSVLPPDAAEENDYCDVATPLTAGASATLTIDNPHDIDWFKFTVPVASAFSVTATATDPDGDLDLYLARDFRPDSLVLVTVASNPGRSESLSGLLVAGNYFLVVVDFPGVSTQYTLSTTATAASAATAAAMTPLGSRVDDEIRRLEAKGRRAAPPPAFLRLRGRGPW